MIARRKLVQLSAGFVLWGALPTWAEEKSVTAQVTLVVPVSAGGAPDVVARLLADQLSADGGQTVRVENKPGAGERIGAEYVARAAPDGRTLLVAPPGSLVLSPFLFPDLPYDAAALLPVSILTTSYLVLIGRPDLGVANVQELAALARKRTLTCASPGLGTPPHLTGALFAQAADIKITHVPYKGLAPALNDLMGSHVDFMFDNIGNSRELIRSGRVKALGVASAAPMPDLPNVPLISETFPGVVASSWFALVAPPKTPPDVVDGIWRSVSGALKSEAVAHRLAAMSLRPVGSTPEEAARFIADERLRWGTLIRQAGLKAEP